MERTNIFFTEDYIFHDNNCHTLSTDPAEVVELHRAKLVGDFQAGRIVHGPFNQMQRCIITAGSTTYGDVRVDDKGRTTAIERTVDTRMGITSTGKIWFRNVTRSVTALSVTAAGYLVVRTRTSIDGARAKWTTTTLPLAINQLRRNHGWMLDAVGEYVTFDQVHPLLEHYGIDDNGAGFDSKFIAAFTNAHTVAELTRNLFGKRKYRKDLVRAVGQAHPFELAVAWSLRGPGVQTDHLVAFLTRNPMRDKHGELICNPHQGPRVGAYGLRGWVRHLDDASRRRLLLATNQAEANDPSRVARTINDICRYKPTATAAMITQARSWHDVEQAVLLLERQRIARQRREDDAKREARELKLQKWYATDAGQAYLERQAAERRERIERQRIEREGRLTRERAAAETRWRAFDEGVARIQQAFEDRVVVANDAEQLYQWGERMGNCIGAYDYDMDLRHCILFAITDPTNEVGAMEANAEVEVRDDGSLRLRQLLGRFNGHYAHARQWLPQLEAIGIDVSKPML